MKKEAHIIAEVGTNHNGQYATAEQLIDVAVEAGANSVKFQIIYPEGLYLPRQLINGTYINNEVFQKRASMMLTDDMYRSLSMYSQSKGIGFSASVFDRRGIELLNSLNVDYIKIASCDLNNSPLLIQAAETGRCLVLSTGMASLGEIEQAVSDVTATGNTNIILMHCVSVYPAPLERMNLGFLHTLQQAFGFPVGLSDHTESNLAAAIAVSMGVMWIEKHLTLDRTSEGFDHAYAMEPHSMASYIADIRSSESACCRRLNKIGTQEATVKQRARRGLYAARDIAVGEIIKQTDILIVRPEGPLRPNDIQLVLGRTLRHAIQQYEPLTLSILV
jgi:sialic acid synthase SpsE